jgi:phenylpyruvate tautomerase PptA (4-oxalocrotonate tautomerase family)
MPHYTVITQDGAVSIETKAKIAEEINRIHATVMKVPKNFFRVVFLSYPKGSGFTGGKQAPTAALKCVLRSGHTLDEKTGMRQPLWTIFQSLAGIAMDQLALSLQEIRSSNAMEMGQIMQAVGHEYADQSLPGTFAGHYVGSRLSSRARWPCWGRCVRRAQLRTEHLQADFCRNTNLPFGSVFAGHSNHM